MDGAGKEIPAKLAAEGGGDEGANTWDFGPNTGGHMGEDAVPCDLQMRKWYVECATKHSLKMNAPLSQACQQQFGALASGCVFGPEKQ